MPRDEQQPAGTVGFRDWLPPPAWAPPPSLALNPVISSGLDSNGESTGSSLTAWKLERRVMNAVAEQVLGAVAKKWEHEEDLAMAQRQAEVDKFILEKDAAEQEPQNAYAVTGIEAAGAELERTSKEEELDAATGSESSEEHQEQLDESNTTVADDHCVTHDQQRSPVMEATMRLLSRSVLQVRSPPRLICLVLFCIMQIG